MHAWNDGYLMELNISQLRYSGLSYMISDYYRSDITLKHFPVLSGHRTFHRSSFILLYHHNFICEMLLEIPNFGIAPIVKRYPVTAVSKEFISLVDLSLRRIENL